MVRKVLGEDDVVKCEDASSTAAVKSVKHCHFARTPMGTPFFFFFSNQNKKIIIKTKDDKF